MDGDDFLEEEGIVFEFWFGCEVGVGFLLCFIDFLFDVGYNVKGVRHFLTALLYYELTPKRYTSFSTLINFTNRNYQSLPSNSALEKYLYFNSEMKSTQKRKVKKLHNSPYAIVEDQVLGKGSFAVIKRAFNLDNLSEQLALLRSSPSRTIKLPTR